MRPALRAGLYRNIEGLFSSDVIYDLPYGQVCIETNQGLRASEAERDLPYGQVCIETNMR